MIREWLQRRRRYREARERLLMLARVWRHTYMNETWNGDDPFAFLMWCAAAEWSMLEREKRRPGRWRV